METIPRSSGEVTDAENEVRQVSTGSTSVLTTDAATTTAEGDSNVVENEQDDYEEYNDEEDEEDDYEYEDDDEVAYSGFLDESMPPEKVEEIVEKPKWRQPSEAAVSMSLRAESEKTGGRRRLAQDLYRIMNQDTEEAGFSLAPVEDSMDKWTIKLFGLDEDSNLAKDMKVLGISNIEIEMNFPEHYPFEPPFVRVVRPRFKRQTGFVMNGALCMELLTKVSSLLFRVFLLRSINVAFSYTIFVPRMDGTQSMTLKVSSFRFDHSWSLETDDSKLL